MAITSLRFYTLLEKAKKRKWSPKQKDKKTSDTRNEGAKVMCACAGAERGSRRSVRSACALMNFAMVLSSLGN
jgi:hypothetical protein